MFQSYWDQDHCIQSSRWIRLSYNFHESRVLLPLMDTLLPQIKIILYDHVNIKTCVYAKALQSSLTPYDPINCCSPGYSVHGVLQARV